MFENFDDQKVKENHNFDLSKYISNTEEVNQFVALDADKEKSPKKNKKIFIFIFVVIFLLLAGAFIFLYYNKKIFSKNKISVQNHQEIILDEQKQNNILSDKDINPEIKEDKPVEIPDKIVEDSDGDNFLDFYEKIYNSDPNSSDTDQDGYTDGNEVIHGYNPNSPKISDKLNDDRNIFYFAYGSNMDFDKMITRCGENNFVGFLSHLNDYKFYFYNRGYANIKPQKSSVVSGVLYKINKQCLSGLDRAEGYPSIYQRQIVKIKNIFGEFDAQVYIVENDNTTGSPSEEYFQTVVDGAIQHGLPKDYIKSIYTLCGKRAIFYETYN